MKSKEATISSRIKKYRIQPFYKPYSMLKFFKYQATGNDFVMIDDRLEQFDVENQPLIAAICNRHFGVGADGLILLRAPKNNPLQMIYFNADGRQSSMCGNGGRCFAKFITDIGAVSQIPILFQAIDGLHEASFTANNEVSLKMINPLHIVQLEQEALTIDTGSPHFVKFVQHSPFVEEHFVAKASNIRNSDRFKKDGINVNFVQIKDEHSLCMRTFERGVEGETLSCGTGVTAAAILAHKANKVRGNQVQVITAGGELSVSFKFNGQDYTDVWLTGPAVNVFEGSIDLKALKY